MADEIKPCPCGKTPERLHIGNSLSGTKWAYVYGGCCGQWEVEFRTGYHDTGSAECYALALSAWNENPRGK